MRGEVRISTVQIRDLEEEREKERVNNQKDYDWFFQVPQPDPKILTNSKQEWFKKFWHLTCI